MKKTIILSIVILFLFINFPLSIFAQEGVLHEPKVSITDFDLNQFPEMMAILDVRNQEGAFVSTLNSNQVSIVEDGETLPINDLVKIDVGVQVVAAVNLTPRFGVYYEEGVQIYEKIQADLVAWGDTLATDDYDLSFITNEGINSKHRNVPVEWVRALNLYKPDYENSRLNLDVLFTAINIASEEAPRKGMGKVVLFYTALIDEKNNDTLDDLIEQAVANNVIVFPIVVASHAYFRTEQTLNIEELALRTGGEMIFFANEEKLIPLDGLLSPFASTYQLSYTSKITNSGEHEIKASVEVDGSQVVSPAYLVSLEIGAPVPVFVDPPKEIERFSDSSDASEDGFLPLFTSIEILIDYPDGRTRELVRSTLFANGQIVAENLVPPFDVFAWDLQGFTETGVQVLSMEVEDQLGLIGKSVETTVQLTIQSPKLRWQTILSDYGYLITIGIAVFAGSVLLVVLILSGVIGPENRAERRQLRQAKKHPESSLHYEPHGIRRDSQPLLNSKKRRMTSRLMEGRSATEDPVTQPVGTVLTKKDKNKSRIRENPNRRELNLPQAILKKLNEDDHTIPGGALLIFNDSATFGSNRAKVDCWINDPSIEAFHARIWLDDEEFFIADQKSTAGTWVNYAPITSEGCRIEDGDLVHLGKFGFRFMLNKQFKKDE